MTQGAEEQRGPEEFPDNVAVEPAVIAKIHFIKSFLGLCRNDGEQARLVEMAEQINNRWGYHGCDMVAAFFYPNLDFERFEKAVDVYVKTPVQDFQRAIEQFWWLMGMGGYSELLEDPLKFEAFRRLMLEQGLDTCKERADIIRRKINGVTSV